MQQRLGMVLALLGEFDTAKQLLHEVAPALGGWCSSQVWSWSAGAAGMTACCPSDALPLHELAGKSH